MRFATCVSGAAIVVLAGQAWSQPVDVEYGVRASVVDDDFNGTPDAVNPNSGLIRSRTNNDEDRAIVEFDVSQFAGSTITSARFVGEVFVNNSFDTGVRSFNFNIYAGNGTADLADFNENTNTIGTGSYQPPLDTSFDFEFDVTSELQSIIDGGASWVGFNVDCIELRNFPNILSGDQDVTSLLVEVEDSQPCLPDVNGDGAVTPTDFTAWINAFNNNLPECDQNGDGACTPTDFTAWINNFNAGC